MKKSDSLKLLAKSLFIMMAVITLAACGEDQPLTPETPNDEPVETPTDEPENPIEEPEEPFSPYFEQHDKIINKAVNNFDMELFRAMFNNWIFSTN